MLLNLTSKGYKVSRDYSGSTFTYGAIVGFHKPLLGSDNIVVGGEISYSLGIVKISNICGKVSKSGEDIICTASIGNLGAVRMHIGSVQGRTLFYANAGVAFGIMTINDRKDGTPGYTHKRTLLGVVVGVGMDTVYMDKYIVRLELSHYNFLKNDSFTPTGFPLRGSLTSLDVSFTEVNLGIIYRF